MSGDRELPGWAEAKELFGLSQEAIKCPHRIFQSLREASPVRWFDEIESFVVTRYDDIVSVLHRPEVFSNRMSTGHLAARQLYEALGRLTENDAELAKLLEHRTAKRTAVLLKTDPPVHTRQRSLVNRSFSAGAVRRMSSGIEDLVVKLVDSFADAGEVEFVSQMAVPLPLTVINQILAVPVDRMSDFKRWSDAFGSAVGNHQLTMEALAHVVRTQAEFFEYFQGVVAERSACPGDDLISQLGQARIDDERLDPVEVLEMVSQFLVAGNETTTKLLTSMMLRLAQDPELAGQLRQDFDLIPAFVEESLRLEAPVTGMYRLATQDTTIADVDIPAGTNVWLVYASANRDEALFPKPDSCDLGRIVSHPHLAFGFGPHFCLGAGLAREEARLALKELLARCHDIRLAIPESEITYEPTYALRGIERLPLTFRPARRRAVGALPAGVG